MPAPGHWDIVSQDSKVVAIHACLLHTGKVLYFASRSYPIWTRLYDPSTNTVSDTIPLPIWPDHPYDAPPNDKIEPSAIFCSGHVFLRDGTLLVAGEKCIDLTQMFGTQLKINHSGDLNILSFLIQFLSNGLYLVQ